MLEILFSYFEKTAPLSAEERILMESVCRQRSLRKGEFLLRAGDLAREGAFVATGLLRSYIIDNKGKEHIVQFAPENWWISDKSAKEEGTKTHLFIEALENSDVILIDNKSHSILLEKSPVYAATFQTGMKKQSASQDKRIIHSLSATAEERYLDFLNVYPSMTQRVPQHMLASYLGITPETLSRIRRQIVKK